MKKLALLICFLMSFSLLASESDNYFKLGGLYGEYKGNEYSLPKNLRGFGTNFGFGHYFGPLALEMTEKIIIPSSVNEDRTFTVFSVGPRLTISNISLFGGASLLTTGDEDMILYYGGIGGQVNIFSIFELYADMMYSFKKIKATEFSSGVIVRF